MKNKLAINGGEKTISEEHTHFIWPEITERTKEMVLKQLNESILFYID